MEETGDVFAWGFWGVLATILSVIAMILIYRAQRKIKNLSYEIISNTQLLGVEAEMQGKVKILYNDEEVNSVHLLTLKFTNFGNQSITSSDYERHLSVVFDSNSKILTHDIIDQEPNNLGVTSEVDFNKISLNKVLMNSKDSFSLKTLISNYDGLPTVDGRITGVKSIGKYVENLLLVKAFMFIALLSIIAAVGVFIFADDEIAISTLYVTKKAMASMLFLISYTSMLMALLSNKKLLKLVVRRAVLRN